MYAHLAPTETVLIYVIVFTRLKLLFPPSYYHGDKQTSYRRLPRSISANSTKCI